MKIYLAAAAIALAGAAALAQPVPVAPVQPVRPMADGAMDRAEVVAMVRNHFGRFDANRDGSITTAEIQQSAGAMAHRGMGAPGAPGNPHVMIQQRRIGDPNAMFERLDSNRDGMISRDEFAKGHELRIEKRIEKRAERGGQDGQRRMMRMHRMGGGGGARMIVMADTNKDGRITLAEAEAMALQHFDQMDSNHDGRVTPEERRAGRAMMRARRMPNAG